MERFASLCVPSTERLRRARAACDCSSFVVEPAAAMIGSKPPSLAISFSLSSVGARQMVR